MLTDGTLLTSPIYLNFWIMKVFEAVNPTVTEQKQTHRYGEKIDSCQMRGSWWDGRKKKGLAVQIASQKNRHADVKYSIGNIVNNIVRTMNDVRWVFDWVITL